MCHNSVTLLLFNDYDGDDGDDADDATKGIIVTSLRHLYSFMMMMMNIQKVYVSQLCDTYTVQ